MNERTALFLASLSHQWFLLVLPLPFVCAVGTYHAGVLQAHARATANALACRVSIGLRFVSYVLLAGSVVVFGAAFFHVGCASLVAHSTQCMSNVKQLALGTLMYSQDYDERLPASTRWDAAIDSRVREAARSNTYARGDPFRCPAAESPASYGMNVILGGLSMSEFDAPANTVLLFEADVSLRSFAGGPQDVARNRHSGAPNVAFADGHAKHVNGFGFEKLNWTQKEATGQRQAGP